MARRLAARRLTLSSVEFGADGLLGGRLAAVGSVFRGGVTIADRAWHDLADVIEAAHHIRSDRGSDLGLASVVIAAPGSRGLKLMIALATADDVKTIERGYGGHAALAAQWASTAALGLVWHWLNVTESTHSA